MLPSPIVRVFGAVGDVFYVCGNDLLLEYVIEVMCGVLLR